MSDTPRIYTEVEMTILTAALNLLRDGHRRAIDSFHGQEATGETWRWVTWAGKTEPAADALHAVVFLHERYTSPVVPDEVTA